MVFFTVKNSTQEDEEKKESHGIHSASEENEKEIKKYGMLLALLTPNAFYDTMGGLVGLDL